MNEILENSVETGAPKSNPTDTVKVDATNTPPTEGDAGAAGNDAAKTKLPDGVTPEPRNPEEMHLKYIKHSPSAVYDYLAVSNDKGEFINDSQVEETIKAFINKYKDKESYQLEKPAVVISKAQTLQKIYTEKMERAGRITDGILTKCGIRRGELLIIEQKLLQKNGKLWIDHYIETYGKRSLRSAQDYMALARTPDIIRYAVFGKERLMEGLRAIKALGIKSEDPMATLLDKYQIKFTPDDDQSEETMMELKQGIDYAVAVTKIQKAEEKKGVELGIEADQVKRLVASGILVNNSFIDDLFIINEEGDVQSHLAKLIGEDGELNEMLPNIKKLNELPKSLAKIKDAVDIVTRYSRLRNRIDPTFITDLESYVSSLKSLDLNGSVTD